MPSHLKKSSNVFSIVTYENANHGQLIAGISLEERTEDARCLLSTKAWGEMTSDP